ncbi:MAG: hypothetical protein JXM79_07565 [Sedimentisphaerales bacterium]|nr:hypothetical protein [Sedimentisphaerales bacterium]
MIRTFIQMSAMILTLAATFFLLKANLGLTPKMIAKLSIPHTDYLSDEFVMSLSKQSADTRVGVALLLLSFTLQMVNSLWPLRWKDFGFDWHGVLVSVGLCIIIVAFADRYSRYLSKKLFDQSIKVIKSRSEK